MPPCLGVKLTGDLRLYRSHPGDARIVINSAAADQAVPLQPGETPLDDDWRVKGITAFTRSIGDCHMKDKGAATVYNTYTPGHKVMPRPGVKPKGKAAAAQAEAGETGCVLDPGGTRYRVAIPTAACSIILRQVMSQPKRWHAGSIRQRLGHLFGSVSHLGLAG